MYAKICRKIVSSSSGIFSFYTKTKSYENALQQWLALTWGLLLPSFSTTLRPLIISPNLQFNTFRPFSCCSSLTQTFVCQFALAEKKIPAQVSLRPSLAICLPSRKVCLAFPPFAKSFLASPNENVKDSAMLKLNDFYPHSGSEKNDRNLKCASSNMLAVEIPLFPKQ